MKTTKILYKNTADGRILIENILSAATQSDVKKEFGREIYRVYSSEGHRYWSYCSQFQIRIMTPSSDESFKVGDVVSKEFFERCIASMKQAAKRLIEIRQQVAAYETKTIEI